MVNDIVEKKSMFFSLKKKKEMSAAMTNMECTLLRSF